MAFNFELSSVFATSKDVCVCKRGLAFYAYEGWAMFHFVSVDVYAPCDVQ
jgi:hypothetical protein